MRTDMHPVLRADWERMKESLFRADLSASERVMALQELANAAEILATDVRRDERRKESALP